MAEAYVKQNSAAAVYIAEIPADSQIGVLSHEARRREIDQTSNPQAKREKYFLWRLLEIAIFEEYGLGIPDMKLEKNENGKWISGECSLSFSHSNGAVAVALAPSDISVGVDIEALDNTGGKESLAERFFTAEELKEYRNTPEACRTEKFLSVWTEKEAIFKMKNLPAFAPSRVSTLDFDGFSESKILTVGERKYILSVAFSASAKFEIKEVKLQKM